MDNSLSLLGIATSLTLPWAFGITWMLFLMGRTCRWNCWIVAGHGYLMGIFLTTLIMRASDFAEFLQNFQGIVAAISLLTLVGIALLCARPPMKAIQPTSIEARQWERAFIVALVFFIVYRYTGLAREILLRPLYPWDAWMNWTPKAINWFHNRQLTEFISPSNWLEYSGDTLAYTTGAANAWKYPVTVPLIQLWGMLGAGSADQNYSNLPWLFAPLAFSLSLYGHLRLVGASSLLATMASYFFLSLPYIGVHTALAGYADIWLAIYFGAAILILQEWRKHRNWNWAALGLFYGFACTQLKLPGLVLGAIILSVLVIYLIELPKKAKIILVVVTSATLVYVLSIGIDVNLPAIGHVVISAKKLELPYLGSFDLQYHSVHDALLTTIFSMSNWHIFWYLIAAGLIAKAVFGGILSPISPELLTTSMTLLFFGVAFYFTHIYAFVLDFSTVNRAILYVIPGFLFYLFRNIHEWNEIQSGKSRAAV